MPITSIIILAGIVCVFATFGLALAWGQYQTRHLSRGRAAAEPQAPHAQDDTKMAA